MAGLKIDYKLPITLTEPNVQRGIPCLVNETTQHGY